MDGTDEIDNYMKRYREPAIMCMRPYGHRRQPNNISCLGGLPWLPEGVSWPRSQEDIPLHFLAAINLAELPKNFPQLPVEGMLFFFALIDEDMDWDDRKPGSHYKVIHCTHIGEGPAEAPSDLVPISGDYHRFDEMFRMADEPRTTVYPRWPLEFLPIHSWPDASALGLHKGRYPDPFHWEFNSRVRSARQLECIRATNLMPSDEKPDWGEWLFDQEGRRMISLPTDEQTNKFPYCWLVLDLFCRALVVLCREDIGKLTRKGKQDEAATLEKLASNAGEWVERARSSNKFSLLTAEEMEAFASWFMPLCKDDRFSIYYVIERALKRALKFAVARYMASGHTEPRLLPLDVIKKSRNEHLPFRHHQIFGNASSSQQARPIRRAEHLLLQLESDDGVDFSFCDLGEITFWIDQDDLKRGRFDRAWAETHGG